MDPAFTSTNTIHTARVQGLKTANPQQHAPAHPSPAEPPKAVKTPPHAPDVPHAVGLGCTGRHTGCCSKTQQSVNQQDRHRSESRHVVHSRPLMVKVQVLLVEGVACTHVALMIEALFSPVGLLATAVTVLVFLYYK